MASLTDFLQMLADLPIEYQPAEDPEITDISDPDVGIWLTLAGDTIPDPVIIEKDEPDAFTFTPLTAVCHHHTGVRFTHDNELLAADKLGLSVEDSLLITQATNTMDEETSPGVRVLRVKMVAAINERKQS